MECLKQLAAEAGTLDTTPCVLNLKSQAANPHNPEIGNSTPYSEFPAQGGLLKFWLSVCFSELRDRVQVSPLFNVG